MPPGFIALMTCEGSSESARQGSDQYSAAVLEGRRKVDLLQRSGAEHFVFAECFEGGSRDRGDGNGIADGVEDFDGVPLCVVGGNMVVHQLDDVAATETMLRQVARQHCILVEFQLHHTLRLSGMSVTNFVTPNKCSAIQMVRTASVTPFGPASVPRIS